MQPKEVHRTTNASLVSTKVDLSGEWIGRYQTGTEQVIKISHRGDDLIAVKITGDEHVPGGAETFRANVLTGAAEVQIAEKEFRRAQFIPCKLQINSSESIVLIFPVTDDPEMPRGRIEFRKDD